MSDTEKLPPTLYAEVAKEINGETIGPVFAVDTFVPIKELVYRYVQAVMIKFGHNKTLAARMLGVDRRTLYRILSRGL